MANALYAKAKEGFLEGLFDLTDNTIKLAFVKSLYSVNLNTHEFLSDIDEAYVAATSGSLSDKTTNSGVFDASNVNVENYGNSGFSYIIIYKDTGVRSTSRLIAYIDTATGLPAPATTENVSITINWSNDAYKIFGL